MGVITSRITELDRRWLLGVARRQPPAWLDRALRLVTHCGGATATIALGVLLTIPAATRSLGGGLLAANLMSHLVVQLVKRAAVRPRPFLEDGDPVALAEHPDDWSLPSGHSCASMALAMTMVLWDGTAPLAAIAVLGLAVAVGVSRVYLRVHYVTDVLAGQAIGIAGSIVAVSMLG